MLLDIPHNTEHLIQWVCRNSYLRMRCIN